MSKRILSLKGSSALVFAALCSYVMPAMSDEVSFVQFASIAKANPASLVSGIGVALSEDGAHAYSANYEIVNDSAGRVNHYTRDALTGELTFQEAKIHALDGDGLAGVFDLLLSSDGKHLYAVGGVFNATLTLFKRDLVTGVLGSSTVYKFDGKSGLPNMQRITKIKFSADGQFIYLIGEIVSNTGIVVVLKRDSSNGSLALAQQLQQGQSGVSGLEKPIDMVISSEGDSLYVGSESDLTSANIVYFKRDSVTGNLTFGSSMIDAELLSIGGMETTPDGRSVYVSSPLNDMLLAFKRDINSGLLAKTASYSDPSGEGLGLSGASALAFNLYASHLYVAVPNDNSIRVYRRSPVDGALTFVDEVKNGDNGISGLTKVGGLKRTNDNANLYTTPVFSDPNVAAGITILNVPARDVSLQLSSMPSSSQPASMFARIKNNGNGDANDVQFFIAKSDSVNIDASQITASKGACQAGSNGIFCQLGAMKEGESATVSIPKISTQGEFHIVASVMGESDDDHPQNNQVVMSTSNANNLPPEAVDDVVYVVKEHPVAFDFLANDYDPNGDKISLLNIDLSPLQAFGKVEQQASGLWIFTPTTDLSGLGQVDITYTIEDGRGGQATATASFLKNAIPIAGDDEITTFKNNPVDILVLFNDDELDSSDRLKITGLNTELDNLSLHDTFGQVEIVERELTPGVMTQMIRYTPVEDFVGVDYFQYVVEDDKGAESTSLVKVSVVEDATYLSPSEAGAPNVPDSGNETTGGGNGGGGGIQILFVVLLLCLKVTWKRFASRQ